MSAAELYERVAAATCTEHGLNNDAEREAHIRAIVVTVLQIRGMLRDNDRHSVRVGQPTLLRVVPGGGTDVSST